MDEDRTVNVAGLVLAAGAGSRLGRPKAEVTVDGTRLVDLAVDACVRAGLSPVVVVLGAVWLTPLSPGGARERDKDTKEAEIWLVDNADWASGMASSLRAGLAALEDHPDIDAVVITLVDTPGIGAEHVRRIGSILREGGTAAVATYDGDPRTPVGLAREVWAEVAETVTGDEGARRWLRAHSLLVTNVECADLGPWTDIDTPADLSEWPGH